MSNLYHPPTAKFKITFVNHCPVAGRMQVRRVGANTFYMLFIRIEGIQEHMNISNIYILRYATSVVRKSLVDINKYVLR